MRSVFSDLFWQLTRMVMGEACSVPAWSGFNSVLCETNLPVATIRYLPFIHAPPSEFSTTFTTLLKLVAIADRLGQSHILVTADLAIYSKAQQILWTKPDILEGKVTMTLEICTLRWHSLLPLAKCTEMVGSRTSLHHQEHMQPRHPF